MYSSIFILDNIFSTKAQVQEKENVTKLSHLNK